MHHNTVESQDGCACFMRGSCLRWFVAARGDVPAYARYGALALVLAATACDKSAPEGGFDRQAGRSASTHFYQCDSNRTVAVSYPSDDTASVVYQGRTLQMDRAISASGTRYAGDELEWWSKGSGPGSEGTLFRHDSADGSTGETLERCQKIMEK